jgi:hypothetical protein
MIFLWTGTAPGIPMQRMASRKSHRQQSSGNATPEGGSQGRVADALLEEVWKIDLSGIKLCVVFAHLCHLTDAQPVFALGGAISGVQRVAPYIAAPVLSTRPRPCLVQILPRTAVQTVLHDLFLWMEGRLPQHLEPKIGEWLAIMRIVISDGRISRLLTERVLCWIPDGRQDKHLEPWLACHRHLRNSFWKQYWDYHGDGWCRLGRTHRQVQVQEGQLRLLLWHTEIPLHNNPAELGARGGCANRW